MINAMRPYQARACCEVAAAWGDGARSVLVVAPPGSGKTEIGINIIRSKPGAGVLVVVHTRSLALQWEARLKKAFGEPVSLIMEGRNENPSARLHVAVVHSLLQHGLLEGVGLVILDEAHHYAAEQWKEAKTRVSRAALILGLTATPERDDGKPLGDIFSVLVVAAQYSELIAGGWIVPARVIAPRDYLHSHYAQHPADAWAQYSEGRPTIAFYPHIREAESRNREFANRGISTMPFHSDVPDVERAITFDDFSEGRCMMLSTVAAAIEGLDVPHCGAILSGRSFNFIGGYLQATGRVLRPHPGKRYGIVIDLTGASVRHGLPDQDRVYSLEGRPISGGHSVPSPGGGGLIDPEVLDREMRMIATGGVEDPPTPVSLPEPDPLRLKRELELKKLIRKAHTKYGKEAAARLRKELEGMYL